MAPPGFKIIKQALADAKVRSWRDDVRRIAGPNGEYLHENILRLAKGEAIIPRLPDGRMGLPIIPSPDVQLRASMYLHDKVFGTAVAQTEIRRAEEEAQVMESIRALSDEELAREARRILEAGPIDPGPAQDAELVERTWDEIWIEIWNSHDYED